MLGGLVAAVAAVEDTRTHLLRNVYTGPLALVAVTGFGLAAAIGRNTFPVGDLVLGALIFTGPWLISFLVSPSSIGFGDIKFGAGLGLYLGWLGPSTALAGLLAACAIGGGIAIVAIIRRRTGEPFPFGPALLGGASLATIADALALVG